MHKLIRRVLSLLNRMNASLGSSASSNYQLMLASKALIDTNKNPGTLCWNVSYCSTCERFANHNKHTPKTHVFYSLTEEQSLGEEAACAHFYMRFIILV